ncbi:MAG TPA: LysM peptidoglycan-binding domain-containing protein [Candidatus Tidjanibacter faecipullorum]|mgnify:FL=1|uniref:LysM peptidoglycan-binding domain-containing protein n=1 Tax=Candidatus Tidjanibacter faecipullorum TaxID=2838766 RepID=A0A9D2IM37_9BACT|nr:LysM peptidoglycan-binding domain-containing protein [Candidatus Tidjanibacter faecipullorum]
MKRLLIAILAAWCFTGTVAAQQPGVRSTEVVRIADTDYYLHTVEAGETVYSLTRLYGIPEEQFYKDNPAVRERGLQAGETVRMACTQLPEVKMSRRKQQRTFITHVVQAGETTYAIAKRYSLAIGTLIQDNPGLDPAHLKAGQELLIRKSEMDKTSPQQIMSQMDDFASTLSEVSDEYTYHLVELGETFYSISRKYNVPVAAIEEANHATDVLKAGTLLRIPTVRPAEPQVAGPAIRQPEAVPVPVETQDDVFRPHKYSDVTTLSVLLPLTQNGTVRPGFMEFWQGALIAAAELRDAGYPMVLNLFDTQHSLTETEKIVENDAFRNSDLIIGPVYEEMLPPVMAYSRRTGTPVVSPLADFEHNYGKTLYRMSPAAANRYDKMEQLLDSATNIVFITTSVTDTELEREMKQAVGNRPYQRLVYRKGTPSEQIDAMVQGKGSNNVFVVLAGDEAGVDLVLAALSSVQNNRLARSIRTGSIRVVGDPKWLRYRNLDRNLFFKLNVSFVTSYHADRGNEAVREFDRRYIASFGRIPTLYSYRGYDAVMLFGKAAADGTAAWNTIQRACPTPLETPYDFVPVSLSGDRINRSWALVTYNHDYTITVH